jgi:hypothetical protein
MKLKPLLLVAGAAGAVAAVIKRRGAGDIQQAASSVAAAAPQPVKDAVETVVDKVTPGGDEPQEKERYEPPIEGLAQTPTEPGGPPSDATVVRETPPAPGLNEPEHDPPEGSVMPDISDDDPLVRQQENAAIADAAAIGGDSGDTDLDPATRAVIEGSGDENEETFEAREGTERGNREVE